MPEQLFLKLTGSTQGEIKGSVSQKGHEGKIEVLASEHSIDGAVTATGRKSGKATHGPLVITKHIDKASVLLYSAFLTNELITKFKLEYYKTDRTGVMRLHYSIELAMASITSIKQTMASTGYTDAAEREILAFSYKDITWTFAEGGLSAQSNSTGVV